VQFCTPIEAAAITIVYALFSEGIVHRDLHPTRDVPRVLVKGVSFTGGVFIILDAATAFTSYLLDAEVPLILPISQAFGIRPFHLRSIFLANLELGYLTPPVGLNLFLAS